jgi:hypothetical protein
MSRLENLAALIPVSIRDIQVDIIAEILSTYPPSIIDERIRAYNDIGFQGNVGNGFRTIARILNQI